MTTRFQLRPGLVLVGLGALVPFLLGLVVVFLQEDATRRAEVDGQRAALEAFATASLRRALEDDWRVGAAMMESALADPLLDDSRLLLISSDSTLLPRRAGGTEGGIAEELERLMHAAPSPPSDEEDPRLERMQLVAQLAQATSKTERDRVTELVRTFLSHRRQYRIDVRTELATTLAVVELLQTRSTPVQQLIERMLRSGFGPGEPGLQRFALEAAGKLSAEGLEEVCQAIVRQSRRAQVPVDDFVRRCQQVQTAQPWTFAVTSEAFTLRERWLLRGGSEVRGVEVSVEALAKAQERSLRERGLLIDGDRLMTSAATGPLEALSVNVESARWSQAAQSRSTALALKLGLLALALAFGVGVVALSFAVQRRERALVEAKSALVSTVSHELRTPLASLRVMAETLERKLEGVPQAKDWPARIVGEVDGLSVLVENILSFNRLEQGKDVLQRRPWRVDELRGWLEADAGPAVRVSVRGTEGLEVEADPSWMKVALLNLLRNAQKYNERTPVEFSVSATVEGARLVLEVRDNGIGIPREHWSDVFEAFFRVRDARGRGGGGSGLGLALVKRVVEGHGGTIEVKASSPEGTVFRVSLPSSQAS